MRRLLLAIFAAIALVLTACSTPEPASPAPTLEAIDIVFPAALKPWANTLAGCAKNNPQAALYFTQSPELASSIFSAEITLSLGEPARVDASQVLSQLGYEQIVVLVNSKHSLANLTLSQLQSIYTGQTAEWPENTAHPIQVWEFPSSDPARVIFDQVVLAAQPSTTNAMLAPDPPAMLEAISGDVDAIGYVPESFLLTSVAKHAENIKIIQLDPALKEALHLPVIAITHGEPSGLVRELLVCAQTPSP